MIFSFYKVSEIKIVQYIHLLYLYRCNEGSNPFDSRPPAIFTISITKLSRWKIQFIKIEENQNYLSCFTWIAKFFYDFIKFTVTYCHTHVYREDDTMFSLHRINLFLSQIHEIPEIP